MITFQKSSLCNKKWPRYSSKINLVFFHRRKKSEFHFGVNYFFNSKGWSGGTLMYFWLPGTLKLEFHHYGHLSREAVITMVTNGGRSTNLQVFTYHSSIAYFSRYSGFPRAHTLVAYKYAKAFFSLSGIWKLGPTFEASKESLIRLIAVWLSNAPDSSATRYSTLRIDTSACQDLKSTDHKKRARR